MADPLDALKKASRIYATPGDDLRSMLEMDESPPNPPQHPVMRARTWSEAISDTLRKPYQWAADSLPGMLTDALGLSDFKSQAENKPVSLQQIGMMPIDPPWGGMKGMFSRVTEAAKDLPTQIHPTQALKKIQATSSGDEINLRKLGDFLKAKDPNVKIPSAEIRAHLESNPNPVLTEKLRGDPSTAPTQQQVADSLAAYHDAEANRLAYLHQNQHLIGNDQLVHADARLAELYQASQEASLAHNRLLGRVGRPTDPTMLHVGQHEEPYPISGSYRERTIALPEPKSYAQHVEDTMKAMQDKGLSLDQTYGSTPGPLRDVRLRKWGTENLPENIIDLSTLDPETQQAIAGVKGGSGEWERQHPTYQSPHWPNEKNILSHSAWDERNMPHPTGKWAPEDFISHKPEEGGPYWNFQSPSPDEPGTIVHGFGDTMEDAQKSLAYDWNTPGMPYPKPKGDKIRYIQEIQGDWNQRGRTQGYLPDPMPPRPSLSERQAAGNASMWAYGRYRSHVEELARQVGLDPLTAPDHEIYQLAGIHRATDPEIGVQADRAHNAYQEYTEANDVHQRLNNAHTGFGRMVPENPFKKNWQINELKAHVRDVMEDPTVHGLGITSPEVQIARGGSHTIEGHNEWYGRGYPKELEKIVKPFGGTVEQRELPGAARRIPNVSRQGGAIQVGGDTVAHVYPPFDWQAHREQEDQLYQQMGGLIEQDRAIQERTGLHPGGYERPEREHGLIRTENEDIQDPMDYFLEDEPDPPYHWDERAENIVTPYVREQRDALRRQMAEHNLQGDMAESRQAEAGDALIDQIKEQERAKATSGTPFTYWNATPQQKARYAALKAAGKGIPFLSLAALAGQPTDTPSER